MSALLHWIVSRCLPRDDAWVDELVRGVTDDDVGAAEAYVDCSKDSRPVGETEALSSEVGFSQKPKVRKELLPLLRKVMSHIAKFRKTERCTDLILWQECYNGTPEFYQLVFGDHESPEVKPETPVHTGADVVDGPVNKSKGDGVAFVRKVDQVECVSHRRIRKHKKRQFVSALANEIKAKLGIPKRTPANLLTVRHLVYTRCREVNLRAVDTRHAVEQVIELVFLPDEVDIGAAKIRNSRIAMKQRAYLNYENKSALFRWVVGRETYASWSWSQTCGQDQA